MAQRIKRSRLGPKTKNRGITDRSAFNANIFIVPLQKKKITWLLIKFIIYFLNNIRIMVYVGQVMWDIMKIMEHLECMFVCTAALTFYNSNSGIIRIIIRIYIIKGRLQK